MVFPGEVWIGLDKLHQLTSARSYSLEITMTDYDGKKYRAVYEQFEEIKRPQNLDFMGPDSLLLMIIL